jgi:acetyl-CoA acetyltransferase
MTLPVNKFEKSAVISGVGRSAIGRRLGRSELSLTVEAARSAISDAGLTPAEVDGLIAWPGEYPAPAGFTGPSPWRLKDALRLNLNWHLAAQEGPGQLAAVMSAIMAVHSGLCRHVLVYRACAESTGQSGGGRTAVNPVDEGGITGYLQWLRPFGAVSAANWVAMNYQRYLHDTGARREQVAWLAINQRRNAALNPAAIYTEPLSVDDYLQSKMISEPLCLYDCDVPADGAVALVVSAAETAGDTRGPIRIEAVGSAIRRSSSWDQWRSPTEMAATDAAAHLWTRTDLTAADVDVAALYDGFTFLTLVWLEALGFCKPGEAADFVDGGEHIALDGELPLNTGGGQLSSGRLHGYGHLFEACTQLRHRAEGGRQVARAEVALVAAGGGPHGGCLLLTRSM